MLKRGGRAAWNMPQARCSDEDRSRWSQHDFRCRRAAGGVGGWGPNGRIGPPEEMPLLGDGMVRGLGEGVSVSGFRAWVPARLSVLGARLEDERAGSLSPG